ncbi:MAG: cytochrome c oxidase accessory protein CcoG [Flavobacteriales bacterium]|nr:cytochrome c oxidase accessory protein CcoG [Flavobacteriales bacterium]
MSQNSTNTDQSYRDKIATVDGSGKRLWIFPKKPFGKFYNWRKITSYFLIAILLGGPFITVQGQPLLMLNILERKFVIFGKIFWPQDIHLFALLVITGVVFIILFTVIFGRLFCGWVCPQTIFMEMLFRRIEYWFEGDWKHQQKLSKMPWNFEKIRKRGGKWLAFWVVSFVIANVFLAYIIGSKSLISIITDPISAHIGGLSSLMIFTTIFFLVFAWFREQVCTVVCPYGRLQGVLLDRNSVVVAYDHKRGESRGKYRKGEDRTSNGKGDCIDCSQCVHVCPTGIDIRNGTQLECVNCTACIDACDFMMEKTGLEKGLIRYASENQIETGTKFQFTTRMIASSAVLGILMVIFTVLLITRTDVELSLLRAPGMLYQEKSDNHYSNLYTFKLINKTNKDFDVTFKVENKIGEVELVGDSLSHIKREAISEGALFILLKNTELEGKKTPLVIGVYKDEKRIDKIKTTFIGPKI